MALVIPLAVLGFVAAYFGGVGIEQASPRAAAEPLLFPAAQIVSAVLHLAWILPASRRRAAALIAAAWAISLHFCHLGLMTKVAGASAGQYAILAELVPLFIAPTFEPRATWAERLARWRRARENIGVQLRMAEGLLSWMTSAVRQTFLGAAAPPPAAGYRRLVAELEDSEDRLHTRLRGLVLPEQLRQSIVSSADAAAGISGRGRN